MHVAMFLHNLFPLINGFFGIHPKVMCDMQSTKAMVDVADCFSFSSKQHIENLNSKTNNFFPLMLEFILKKILMMVRSVINSLNVSKAFIKVSSTCSAGTTNHGICSVKCLKVLKYVSASPECIGSIARVNDPDPVLT